MKEFTGYRKFSFAIIVIAGFVTVTSLYWDAWWHGVVGRESLWIPPHIAMFAGLGVVIIGFLLRLWGDSGKSRKLPIGYVYLITGIILIFLSFPVDDLWHRKFGVEFGATALVLWSPPHLFGVGSGILAALGVLHTLVREADELGQSLFAVLTTVQFALASSLITLVFLPFEPTTVLHVLGIYGVPFLIFPFMLPRFSAFQIVRRVGLFTLMAMVNWIHLGMLLSVSWHGQIIVPFSIGVIPAIIVDILIYLIGNQAHRTKTMFLLASIYAFTFALIFYPTTNLYRNIGYSVADIAVMVVLATVAAGLAGYLSPAFAVIFAKEQSIE